ncbi:hypothetical protein GCM10027348_12150 [Hymenobacter tenuis]
MPPMKRRTNTESMSALAPNNAFIRNATPAETATISPKAASTDELGEETR